MLCQDCPKKSGCVELCAEAELYVNQDFVTVGAGVFYKNIENYEEYVDYDDEMPSVYLKARERAMVINLHSDGKSTDEIAYHVPYTKRQIRRIVAEYKKGRTF